MMLGAFVVRQKGSRRMAEKSVMQGLAAFVARAVCLPRWVSHVAPVPLPYHLQQQ